MTAGTVRAAKRLQMNIQVTAWPTIPYFAKLGRNITFPFMWAEEVSKSVCRVVKNPGFPHISSLAFSKSQSFRKLGLYFSTANIFNRAIGNSMLCLLNDLSQNNTQKIKPAFFSVNAENINPTRFTPRPNFDEKCCISLALNLFTPY